MRLGTVVVCLFLTIGAYAQEAPAPEMPPPPPDAVVVEPSPPPVEEVAAPVAPAAPAPYVERGKEYPAGVGEFVATHSWVSVLLYLGDKLGRPLLFVALLLVAALGATHLLSRLVADLDPHKAARSDPKAERPTWWPYSAAAVLGWAFGLGVASEAAGLKWVGEVMSAVVSLLGALLSAAAWLAVIAVSAGLIAFTLSGRGREIVLSLIGAYYITRHPERPPADHRFALPGDREGTIVHTEILHSTLKPIGGGDNVVVPNSYIMRRYYNWAAEETTE